MSTNNFQIYFTFEQFQKMVGKMTSGEIGKHEMNMFLVQNFTKSFVQKYTEIMKEQKIINNQGHMSKTLEFFQEIESGKTLNDIIDRESTLSDYRQYFTKWLEEYARNTFGYTNDPLGDNLEIIDSEEAFSAFHQESMVDFLKKMNSLSTSERCKHCDKGLNFKNLFKVDVDPELESIQDCAFAENIHTLEFEVPSGVLLVNDWFRDDDDVLKNLTDIENSKYGQKLMEDKDYKYVQFSEANIQEFAQVMAGVEQNLVTVFTGNTSPSIYQNGNSLVVCEEFDFTDDGYDEDEETEKSFEARVKKFQKELKKSKWTHQERVCTGLWRVSLIDQDILKNMMFNHCGDMVKAEDWVNKFHSIDVDPGKYRVTFSSKKYSGIINEIKGKVKNLDKLEPLIGKDNLVFMTIEKVE